MHRMCVLSNTYNYNRRLQNSETCQNRRKFAKRAAFVPPTRRVKPTDISAFASVIRPTLSRTHVFANAYQLTRATTNRAYDVRNRGQRSAMYTRARINTRARHPRACTHARVNAWPRIFAAPPPVASANFTTRIAHARGTL